MGERPKHPTKELEAILKEAESRGWSFTKGKRYYKGRCSCEGKHLHTVKLTPSDPKYPLNLRKWFERNCWKG